MSRNSWKIWIDTGGTFSDCLATSPGGELKRLKVLSSSVLRLKLLEQTGGSSFVVQFPFEIRKDFFQGFTFLTQGQSSKVVKLDPKRAEIFVDRHYSSVSDAVAELKTDEEVPVFAARLLTETSLRDSFPLIDLRLGSTRGTNALLERRGARTGLLVTKGLKDLLLIGDQQRPDLFALNILKESPLYDLVIEIDERINADGSVRKKLEIKSLDSVIAVLKRKKIDSVAIALMNSYRNPIHEQVLEDELREKDFRFVSASHDLSNQIKILPRAITTVVNAYLDPVIREYVHRVQEGLGTSRFYIMSSAGGLLTSSDFKPKDSLLSGPAGGVIGSFHKSVKSGRNKIITFDMGGTSTDVSLCNERPDYRFESTVGKLKILSPSVAIETIAAGGGSICEYDGYRFMVGPHSAGADPGPACYGKGGPLTITDVNLLLGRLDEDNFSIPIKREHSVRRLNELLACVNQGRRKKITTEEVLESFLEIANEKMAEAIKKVSLQRGFEVGEYSMLCFGGAGGQHACALASMLSVGEVIVPYDAGLLSAYGIGQARVERVGEKLFLLPLDKLNDRLDQKINELYAQVRGDLIKEGFRRDAIHVSHQLLFLRLKGQETAIEIEYNSGDDVEQKFKAQYKKIYGHWLNDRLIELEMIRVVVAVQENSISKNVDAPDSYWPEPEKEKHIYSEKKWKKCRLYRWEKLQPGADIAGPAVVVSNNSTLFIEGDWSFFLDANENAILKRNQRRKETPISLDVAKLELYANRFTSIARDMGALLQRTSFSVNVKERLDFSCALLDANGNLIVNAPHIPVHLGSLGVCVRAVRNAIAMKQGDVVITNHPAYGGSHLPDITLIKPVFIKNKLIGFVANRAHHAEVGGKKPGSMPADARTLLEEGAVITPTHLMKNGKVNWKKIEQILVSPPYPSRNIQENLADLNGALASVLYGEKELRRLCKDYGADEVTFFMKKIYQHSAFLMKRKINLLPKKKYEAIERLDDGTILKVALKHQGPKLIIDFSGSSKVHPGNLNATEAIVHSVVLYALRLLVNEPLPLNEGLLEHVKLVIPSGLLNPKFGNDDAKSPAVVGGNTEVSQRLTDTLLKALGLASCSQGTMNNFLFGNKNFGYYETICGGTGAGPGFNGADAVHQHMTNTRITDPEVLEFRYPVVLEQFSIRKGSGGKGKWSGGNGVVREIVFKEKMDINILSQHRVEKPYGVKGGEPGRVGSQTIVRSNGKKEKLKGIDGKMVYPGDRIIIETPGGGGWGKAKS